MFKVMVKSGWRLRIIMLSVAVISGCISYRAGSWPHANVRDRFVYCVDGNIIYARDSKMYQGYDTVYVSFRGSYADTFLIMLNNSIICSSYIWTEDERLGYVPCAIAVPVREVFCGKNHKITLRDMNRRVSDRIYIVDSHGEVLHSIDMHMAKKYLHVVRRRDYWFHIFVCEPLPMW